MSFFRASKSSKSISLVPEDDDAEIRNLLNIIAAFVLNKYLSSIFTSLKECLKIQFNYIFHVKCYLRTVNKITLF